MYWLDFSAGDFPDWGPFTSVSLNYVPDWGPFTFNIKSEICPWDPLLLLMWIMSLIEAPSLPLILIMLLIEVLSLPLIKLTLKAISITVLFIHTTPCMWCADSISLQETFTLIKIYILFNYLKKKILLTFVFKFKYFFSRSNSFFFSNQICYC